MSIQYRYAEIERALRERIESGLYSPGSRLPGLRAIAKEFGVTAMTVKRAIDVLQTEGMVEGLPRSGIIVRPRADWRGADEVSLEGSRLIGLVAFDTLVSPYWSAAVGGIERRLSDESYHLVLGNSSHSAERAIQYVRSLKQKGIDGLIYVPIDAETAEEYRQENLRVLQEIELAQIPYIIYDRLIPGSSAGGVTIDNRGLASELIAYLAHSGTKNPLCISVSYSQAIAEREKPFIQVFPRDREVNLLRIHSRRITEEHLVPIAEAVNTGSWDGIYCINSSVLNGYLRAMETGLIDSRRIPGRIVSFEDFSVRGSETIDARCIQDVDLMAEAAAELILHRIERKNHRVWGGTEVTIKVPGRLVFKEKREEI